MNLLDLIFPRHCLSCQELIKTNLFCSNCLEHLYILPREGRCTKCFEEIPLRKGICFPCRSLVHPFKELAACFEYQGPAKMLIHALENKHQFLCAKDIAAFMVMQIHALEWPIPDLIVPLPKRFSQSAQLIVKSLSKLLQRPFHSILSSKWELVPQFTLKKKCNIYRQKILLVTTTMNTRSSMRSGAQILENRSPLEIYGLAFCVI